MTIVVDGALLPADRAPVRDARAFAPFETMGAVAGHVPLWRHHVERIAAAAARLHLSFAPSARLVAAAEELLRTNGHGDGILRLSLVPSGGRVHEVLTSRDRGPSISVVTLLPTVVARTDTAPRDLKVEPRPFYDAVRAQAQDGGADDGIVVDRDGAVLETAVGNLWLRLSGRWTTPPLDGRVLPGIARARLVAAARSAGGAIDERPCGLGDLHRAEALACTNAVYGPRAAVLRGTTPPADRFVDTELLPLWRAVAPE